jgi:hypothetical protein
MIFDEDSDEEFQEMNEENQMKVCQAFLQFNSYFSQYIKEMNPDLWKKAVDFAKDSVDIPGVELKFLDDDKQIEE